MLEAHYETVAQNGFISLGAQYAGCRVLIEHPTEENWYVKVHREPAQKPHPLDKWVGTGVMKLPTDDIMRLTRGDDWGRE